MKTRTYSELRRLTTFEERYDYLRLGGVLGAQTFGHDRWLNQQFYKSREWVLIRDLVIVRDNGCDLGVEGFEIFSGLIVHHMNPISVENLANGLELVTDPDYLITTSLRTHNAIHYGDKTLLPRGPVERQAGDTKLW